MLPHRKPSFRHTSHGVKLASGVAAFYGGDDQTCEDRESENMVVGSKIDSVRMSGGGMLHPRHAGRRQVFSDFWRPALARFAPAFYLAAVFVMDTIPPPHRETPMGL